MSGEKATSPCNKFEANIFNKSKCQNCFKSRELHLLTDHGMEQAKPIYAGWLCLAPVGTDFDNPMQRSRKWQRRFFIMYEDGSLSFALDELPSTLPQGTVNMNQCTDIADAESRTGQRNALCIATPEQEIFIRGDGKEIINGWSEQLAVYLRTNKQNQKKKRKVEPVATQEPSPAKMAATDPGFPASQNNSESGLCRTRWQEDQQQGRTPGETPMWTVPVSGPPGPEKTPAGNTSSYLSPASLDLVTSGNTDRDDRLAEPNNNQTSANNNQIWDESPAERLQGLEATGKEQEVGTAVSRTGRSDARSNRREKLPSCGDVTQLSAPPPQRRAKSLDRRTSDTIMTPDLLNFKKGWMVKLDADEKWKKYWFVLSTDSLRFYKDSIAEEASDLEGEIDLTKCYNVSEYQVQRNYGFQIHTPKGVFTLSAMTSGIRKNWIQALMKNVRPANAPDVASLPGHHGPCSPPEVLPRPDVTQDSADVSADPKHRTVTERRREGRYKTFDWAEFRPPNKQRTKAPSCLELGDLERRRRREERRRRYESMLGFPLGWEMVGGPAAVGGGVRSLSPKSQQKVEEDMEECWRRVEKTAFRMDRSVSLLPDTTESEVEKLLDGYKTGVEDLKVRLAESERLRLDLEAQLRAAGFFQQQPDPPLSSDTNKNPLISFEPPAPSIWLHDTDGNHQELEHLSPETEITPLLLSPASESSFTQSDGQTVDLNVATINHKNQQDPSAETQINTCEYSSLILGEPAKRDESLSCCVDQHGAPDQEVVRRLSQEVELLASQNEALNQRNQEMLNQLTEADREIERLKVELSSRYTEPHHLPEVEQLGQTRVEDLERELSSRDQQLLEAQTLISSLEENLREMEALLQLNVATETEEQENKGYLLRCFEATEAKLTELERQLDQSELSCMELRTLNAELKEAEKRHRQTAAEAEADARRLSEELEKERLKDGGSNGCVSGEGRIRQVIDGMVVRLEALEKLLGVIENLDFGWREEETVESQLRWEEEFWSLLLDRLKPSELNEENPDEELLSEVTERMMVEKQMLLLGRRLLSETSTEEGREGLKDPDVVWNIESETETETTGERSMFDLNELCEMRHFRAVTQVKISFLNRLASSACDKLQLMADFHFSEHPWSGFIHSAATEALLCCHLSRLQAEYKRQLEETKQISSVVCSNCVDMREENRELRARLLNVEESSSGAKLTDAESHLQDAGEENETGSDADAEVLELRRRVEELEEKLGVTAEEMKEEFDGKMSSVQTQHEKEMEKLKVTCERGFASMEASHLKVEEELRRRHQQEVARLLVERDRLLEEESAATATAIEAIKNAHRLELEREVQKRWRSESSAGNAHLDDVYLQHSEELASFQRELQVLSQQFSLKCLENGHLVQALDAERKALCQCQQENQDLRTRNQELSGHLAAEITRLCSLAKQDALPLSQGMDVYEMEITLRVKESEVQCLKQEITSLRDDLQSAQRDKRNATKKYKDMYTELSITRAKTERDMDELRENLRLAHHALHQTSL